MTQFTETEHWHLEQARSFQGLLDPRKLPQLAGVAHLMAPFWPFLEPYYSPVHPLFSFEFGTPERLQSQRIWQLRDGSLPLHWFFSSVSPHAAAGVQLLVHASQAHLVPPAWEAATEFYHIYAEQAYRPTRLPKRIVLIAPANQMLCDFEEAQATVAAIAKLRQKAPKLEVQIYCPAQVGIGLVNTRQTFEGRLYQLLFDSLGTNLKALTWEQLEASALKETAIAEWGGRWFVADSYATHRLLSLGAGLFADFGKKRKKGTVTKIALSPYHGIERAVDPAFLGYERSGRSPSEELRFLVKLREKMLAPPNTLAWRRWYEGFRGIGHGGM